MTRRRATGLDRADRYPEDGGNLLHRQAEPVVQRCGGTQRGRQGRQRPPCLLVLLRGSEAFVHRRLRAIRQRVRLRELPPAALRQTQGFTHHDAPEPRAHSRGIMQAGQGNRGADERLLNRILGELALAKNEGGRLEGLGAVRHEQMLDAEPIGAMHVVTPRP